MAMEKITNAMFNKINSITPKDWWKYGIGGY